MKHIISIMLENHSFDNMLGYLNGTNGVKPTSPCNTQTSTGESFCPTKRGAYSDPDPDHSVDGTSWQLYGTENPARPNDPSTITLGGFVDSYEKAEGAASARTIMDCFAPEAVPIISTLAQTFTVVDTYHAAVPGPTFPNRLFYFSATSRAWPPPPPAARAPARHTPAPTHTALPPFPPPQTALATMTTCKLSLGGPSGPSLAPSTPPPGGCTFLTCPARCSWRTRDSGC